MRNADLQQRRLVAAAIDVGIAFAIGLVTFVINLLLGLGGSLLSSGTDLDVASGAALFLPRIVGFLGSGVLLVYLLGRDVLAGGRSFGKKFQGIRVVTSAGGPLTFVDSAKRNGIFAISSVLGCVSATLQLVPCLGDMVACLLAPLWILGFLVGLVALVLEIVKIVQEPDGVRMGDQFAGTRVVGL